MGRAMKKENGPNGNPLIGIRQLVNEIQQDPLHCLNVEYLTATMVFGSADARELILRQIMRRLVFAVEVMTHEKDFSQNAREELAAALDLAGIFAQRGVTRVPTDRLAYTVSADPPDGADINAEIMPIHQSVELH
jgi:hypothetical protein